MPTFHRGTQTQSVDNQLALVSSGQVKYEGMLSIRHSRFERSPGLSPIQITHRDQEILRHVLRHRLLRSCEIVALAGGSAQQVLRRLQLLYHHGLLERPRCQIDYYHRAGSRPIVYSLTPKGSSLLSSDRMFSRATNAESRLFLEHAVQTSEILVAIELACQRSGRVRFLSAREILPADKTPSRSLRWSVNIDGTIQIGVIPDAVFGLEYLDREPSANRAYFFLESDRSTMPLTRRDFAKTSFLRKLLAYEATWKQKLHQSRFGFHRFRVLTVTTNIERVTNLISVCQTLKSARGLFLFTDMSSLRATDALGAQWQSANGGSAVRLID